MKEWEAAYMKSMAGKEWQEAENLKIYTIEYIPGMELDALGLVSGTVVQSTHFGHDFMAGLKNLVGGEIESYTEMIARARNIALERMKDEARKLGADAVIGVRFGSSEVMSSAAEMVAYGTAVKIRRTEGEGA